MRKEDAINTINKYIKELGYKDINESLHKNNYGKEVIIECKDLDRLQDILTDLMNGKSYYEIGDKHSICAARVNDIITNYLTMLKNESRVQNRMFDNYFNELNINDEVNKEEFISNYLKVLKGEYPDKYYLYLPPESLDINLTNTYATSLYDLLVNRKHKLSHKIDIEPTLLFKRIKEIYSTMDYEDKERLEMIPIITELENKTKLQLDDKTDEEKIAEYNKQIKKLEKKRDKILKKLHENT